MEQHEDLRLHPELTLTIKQESALTQIAEQIAFFDYLVNPNNRHPIIKEIDKILKELGYR